MSVFANGLEVSGKATPNKTIAAMPDVCLSPPPPPAGPVPLPYPMTGMASDTTDGCTSVIVKGKEAGKKNSTKYSKTMGNEPATNSFGANILTHKLSSSLKFAAYSFDVIFEGGGACRFGDLTTQNHMNVGGGSASTDIGSPAPPVPPTESECEALKDKNDKFRKSVDEKCKPDVAANVNQNHTVSHGNFRQTGAVNSSFTGVSCTNQLAAIFTNVSRPIDTKKLTGKFVKLARLNKKGNPVTHVQSDVCNACTQPIGGLHAHAELNILNDIGRQFGSAPGGIAVLAIDWMSGGTPQAPEPCPNCQESLKCMCDAKCIVVYVCNEEDQPVDRCKNPYKPGK